MIAKPADGTYEPDKRAQLKVKHQRTADCVVAGFREHKDGEGVGSLLLGLYDDERPAPPPRRGRQLLGQARARRAASTSWRRYETDDLDDHPWGEWADAGAHESRRGACPGGRRRWNARKDLSFTPLRPELVAEVAYERVDDGRFRHGARFQRWRADRDPPSCTFDQLEEPAPLALRGVLPRWTSWSGRPCSRRATRGTGRSAAARR